MRKALQELVVPVLRRHGFKGSFPHFRRATSNRIDVLHFQFDKYGGGFAVNIGKCPPEGTTDSEGYHTPPKKVTIANVPMDDFLRLGGKSEQDDHWFRYDTTLFFTPLRIFRNLAKQVIPPIETEAETWWKSSGEWWNAAGKQK